MICNLSLTSNDGLSNEPPFDDKIMQLPLPRNFKISQVESYDGTTNPDDYLASFQAMMLLHGAPNPISIEPFPLPLRGWLNIGT